MEIQPGQTVALVGPSGGGKSTLANLICRFFDVQSGSVRVGGADVRDIPKEELMDTISFVFQNSRLLKGSILDNVRLGRAAGHRSRGAGSAESGAVHGYYRKVPGRASIRSSAPRACICPAASSSALPLPAPC